MGTATIGEQAVSPSAVGAEDIMQAFSLRHDVPTKEFLVAVIESAFFTLSTNIPPTEVREVLRESQIPGVVKASRKGLKAAVVQAELVGPDGSGIRVYSDGSTDVRANLAPEGVQFHLLLRREASPPRSVATGDRLTGSFAIQLLPAGNRD